MLLLRDESCAVCEVRAEQTRDWAGTGEDVVLTILYFDVFVDGEISRGIPW